MKKYLFLLFIELLLSLTIIVLPSYAEMHPMQLALTDRAETHGLKKVVELQVPENEYIINVETTEGLEINTDDTLYHNFNEIKSVQKKNKGYQVTLLTTKNKNRTIAFYLEKKEAKEESTFKASTDDSKYTNQLKIPALKRQMFQRDVTDDDWTLVEDNITLEVGDLAVEMMKSDWINNRFVFRKQKNVGVVKNHVLRISGDLIVNDQLLITDALPLFGTDTNVDMFGKIRIQDSGKTYVNAAKNKILYVFKLDDQYLIEVYVEMTENNDIVKKYKITNQSGETQKIGLSEVSTFKVRSYYDYNVSVPLSSDAINIKTENLLSQGMLFQWEQGSFSNWVYSRSPRKVINMMGYSPNNTSGTGIEQPEAFFYYKSGWATYRDSEDTQEIAAKTSGKMIENNGVLEVYNKMHFPSTPLPHLELNEKQFTVGQGNIVLNLNGKMTNIKNNNYQLVYYDKKDKKVIPIKTFDRSSEEEQTFSNLVTDLGDLSVGSHTGLFSLVNELGIRSNEVEVDLKVLSVGGKPIIQKVPLNDPFEKTVDELMTNLTGKNVKMVALKKPDTSKIGFSTAIATLKDSSGQTIDIRIPVNTYDKKTTTFFEESELAIDGNKEVSVTIGELQESQDWNALIIKKTKLQAWHMKVGEIYGTELKELDLQEIPGAYKATFLVHGLKVPIFYEVDIQVRGFLNFGHVPDFDYGTVRIPTKPTIVSRKTEDQVIIKDERGPNKKWRLTATLSGNLQSISGPKKSGHVIYIHENGEKELMKPEQLIVAKEAETQQTALQPLGWEKNTGLLFEVLPNAYKGNYSGDIVWSLEDVPSD